MYFIKLPILLLTTVLLAACNNTAKVQTGAATNQTGGAGGGGSDVAPNPLCDLAPDPLSNGFQTGDGSEDDPYTICTADQLNSIGDNFLDKDFLVLKDIDLSSIPNFTIIGSGDHPHPFGLDNIYTGTFDGGGFEISNLTITNPTVNYYEIGMFGTLGQPYVFPNFFLGIPERLANPGTVKNVHLKNVVVNDVDDEAITVAGLVANLKLGEVTGSSVSGSVSGLTGEFVGGLVGSVDPGAVISDSFSTANVFGRKVGGLIGFLYAGTVENSYSTGVVSGEVLAGGLIGDVETGSGSPVEITKCYSTSEVVSLGLAGGLIAKVEAYPMDSGDPLEDSSIRITKSYATGDVTGDGDAGGFIGEIYGEAANGGVFVTDSFSRGAVYTTSGGVGGAFGSAYADVLGSVQVTNFYSTGLPDGDAPSSLGYLIGYSTNMSYSNVYWLDPNPGFTDGSGDGPGALVGVTPLVDANMKLSGSFTGFNFTTTWGISPTRNGGYPYLR